MDSHQLADRRAVLLALGAAATAPAWAPEFASAQVAPGIAAIPDVPMARAETVGMSTEGLAKIQTMMAGHIAGNRIQGGVTAVARRNKLVHFQSHGLFDITANTPMMPNAEFVMMSSTKPVTGVALLQQMEAGKVSLSDPISKFIPELKNMRVVKAGSPAPARGVARTADQLEPQAREITIKDLATHTSGLNGSAPAQAGEGPRTLANYIPRLKDTPLDFQPGTKWAYSATTGPDVLARVIEICSGQPYDAYLKEHVFGPIGMSDAGHNLTPEQAARIVHRYQRQGEAWTLARGSGSPPPRTTYFAGAYGLTATARDYLLFETMLLNKGTIHGKRVLKPESVELMHTNLIGDLYKGLQGTTRGTGFGVLVRVVLDPPISNSNRSKGAFGWGGAYGTMSWTDPVENLVAVIMIQQSVDAVQRDFERVVREAMTA